MQENSQEVLVDIPKEDGFYVYLLLCEDDSLYCGWTTNLYRRYQCHKAGRGAKYTRSHHVKELYYYESLEDESSARRREYAIKQLSHKAKCMLKDSI